MNHEIRPLEALFLWRLAVGGGEDWLKEIKPDPKSSARKKLAADGLIEQVKRKSTSGRGAPLYISLTDRGWAWLGNHLDFDLKTRSPAGSEVLHQLLLKLKKFMEQKQISLSDLILAGQKTDEYCCDDVEDRLTKAYLALSNGQTNVRVRIADLRNLLSSVPRMTFDQVLLDMASNGKASLYRLDNPTEIQPEDRDAVLRTPAGEERHVVYFGGRGS
jgi:DNA-binding PadR family transcriptional regulator